MTYLTGLRMTTTWYSNHFETSILYFTAYWMRGVTDRLWAARGGQREHETCVAAACIYDHDHAAHSRVCLGAINSPPSLRVLYLGRKILPPGSPTWQPKHRPVKMLQSVVLRFRLFFVFRCCNQSTFYFRCFPSCWKDTTVVRHFSKQDSVFRQFLE